MTLSDDELQVIQDMSRKDLISFCCYNNKRYIPQKFHEQIADKLENVMNGKIKRLIINIPPQHWKSELVSINFPIFAMGNNPKTRIMAASYSSSLIQHFSRQARERMKWVEFQSLFPTVLNTEWVEHWDIEWWWYYHAVWVWWSSTGFGFDIGLIDDPFKDREEAESETIRNKVWDWYTSTFYTRQGKNAAIILIMTRWHIDDLAGRLLKQMEYGWEKREQLIIPAIDDEDKAIREDRYSREYLAQTKDNIWVRDFSALYMQDPIMSTGAIFKPSTFKYFLESDFEKADWLLKKDDIEFWLFIDPAFSTSTKSDDAVVMAIGRHKITGDIYRFEIYAGTSAPSDTFRAIFNMADRWEIKWYKIWFISIEKVAINKDQTKFIQDFRQEMQLRNKYYTIYEYEPKGKKEDRIKFILERMFDNGKIYFMKWNDIYESKKMEEQLTLFPHSKHDDIIDCLAQSVIVFDERRQWYDRTQTSKPKNLVIDPVLNNLPARNIGSGASYNFITNRTINNGSNRV